MLFHYFECTRGYDVYILIKKGFVINPMYIQRRENTINEKYAMIEESYVSFDTAKMLKEAGFEAECGFIVDDDGRKLYRPTQALAARWLREVYNVAIYSLYDDDMEQWFYVVDAFTKNPVINGFQSGSEYDDHESAFEDGLREAIKLIKK